MANWLRVRDAARQLHVTETTIYRWVSSDSIRSRRLGPRTLEVDIESAIVEDDLAAHVERLIATAPKLSQEQHDRLATLLRSPPTQAVAS